MKSHLFFAILTGLSTSVAFAATSPISTALCPQWAKNGAHANQSYLMRTGVTSERTINDEIFDPDVSRAMRAEYQAHLDSEEKLSNAGLTTPVEEKTRFGFMQGLARRALDTMSRIRLKLEGDKIARYAQNDSSLPKEPIAFAVLTASLYNGRSVAFHVFDTRVESRVVLKDHVAELTAPIGSLGTRATLAYNHAGTCGGDNGCALIAQPITSNVSALLNSADKGTARVVYSISF